MDKTREKLIDVFMHIGDHIRSLDEYGFGFDSTLAEAIEDVVSMLKNQDANGVTVQKWIPVTERLPEDLPENQGKKVINCIVAHRPYSNGKLTSQFRQRKWDKWDNKWYWSKIGGCTVTHWMPLPEPPNE